MNEEELVIACHCERMGQMYIKNQDDSIEPLSDNITYVDPTCKDKTWESIPSLSMKYVWGENCPVYTEFRLGKRAFKRCQDAQLLNILRESYRILKSEGIIIFPLETNYYSEESIETLRETSEINSRYKITIVSIKDAPFILGHKSEVGSRWTFPNENVIIFTKKEEGGGRKNKTRRKKTLRRRKGQ